MMMRHNKLGAYLTKNHRDSRGAIYKPVPFICHHYYICRHYCVLYQRNLVSWWACISPCYCNGYRSYIWTIIGWLA